MRCHVLLALILVTCSHDLTGQEKTAQVSPVTRRVEAAEKRIESNPGSPETYNDLAFALLRWARDNDNRSLYEKAETALDRSLRLSPGNYEARKLQVTVLLGKHEFAQALKLASELNHQVPDDIGGWALLVDTNVASGNYAEAERAAQWILDLRPGSSLGFEKAAGLRLLFGDGEGSAEFFTEAFRRTAQGDTDQRAWLLFQCARAELSAGEARRAADLVNQGLTIFPDSQLGLRLLEDVRSAQGRSQAAK